MNSLYGMKVVTNWTMADRTARQVRFPRSKKKRIRKKWSKERRNWSVIITPWTRALKLGDTLFMHPEMLARLEAEIARQVEEKCFGEEVAHVLRAPTAPPAFSNACSSTSGSMLGQFFGLPASFNVRHPEPQIPRRCFLPGMASGLLY